MSEIGHAMNMLEHKIATASARWNALVPPLAVSRVRQLPALNRAGRRMKKGSRKPAVRIDHHDDGGVSFLHPTKGWRHISARRLGLD